MEEDTALDRIKKQIVSYEDLPPKDIGGYFYQANLIGKILIVLFGIFLCIFGLSLWLLPACLAILIFGFGKLQFFLGAAIGFWLSVVTGKKIDSWIHKILKMVPKKKRYL